MPDPLAVAPDKAREPAKTWFGTDGEALIGKSLSHYLQIRSKPKLSEILTGYRSGETRNHSARVVYLRPGRLVMARAGICPAMVGGEQELLYLVMIDHGPHRQ